MKKTILIFIFLITLIAINAQEKRNLLSGVVLLEKELVKDVHVINKNTNKGTISNVNGIFNIDVKIGDSLFFSHINLQEKLIIISKTIIKEKKLTLKLKEKTYNLEEITLQDTRSIFYVDPEILTNNAPIVNAKTLNLPYANTTVKKDNSIIKFRSGGLISLNNLIDALNGNNRRRKILQKLAKEDSNLSKIRKQYTDDFFITDLKIKKEYINQFLNYCIDKQIIAIYKNKNILELTKLLIKISKEFPHKIENEDLYLTKN